MKFILLLLVAACCYPLGAQRSHVIPEPKVMEASNGRWYLPATLSVNEKYIDESLKSSLVRMFTGELNRNLVFVQGQADVNFFPIASTEIDAHQVDISNQLNIGFTTPNSRLLALVTLKQLLQKDSRGAYWPVLHIEDHADYAWRGLHLDVSRHFFPVADIFWLLDQMAYYKLNTFHWHLTDDQGWRIEIKKYPKLTEVGNRREQTLIGHASDLPEQYDGVSHSGFYSQAEIKAVLRYAQKLGITVVPEIEMPGHARAALAAYPEFACFEHRLPVAQKWGVFEQVYCTKPATVDFLKDILDEVMTLFPSKYIHIGGDEVPKAHWEKCTACQSEMQKHNLQTEAQLQSHFLSQINRFLRSRNRIMLGWDEILEGGLPAGAAVMRWRGENQLNDATLQGAPIIQSPNAHLYFDHYQSKRSDQPLAIGGFTTLQEVYEYHLMPEIIDSSILPNILGGQANLWTEYVPNRKQLEFMLFPRLLALSEIVWSEQRPAYAHFKSKIINTAMPQLDAQKIAYSKAIFETQTSPTVSENGVNWQFRPEVSGARVVVHTASGAQEQTGWTVETSTRPFLEKATIKTNYQGVLVDSFDLTVLRHPMLGENWEISPQPSEFYHGENDFVLTDGIKGRRPWHGAEWLGFRTAQVNLSYTFNEKQKVEALHVGMLLSESSWIYLPDSIVVAYSSNGKKWDEIRFHPTKENSVIPIDQKAKFIRITCFNCPSIPEGKPGAGHAAWLFLDEVFCTFQP